ncbi:MAG: twin-arginine translocase subunit TatC [Planctomycetota bacterium]
MSSKLPADDLFDKSSMSFGEHLEELRKAMGKSLLWLAGGAIIGLLFANQIVQFIETPLREAIKTFHIEQAKVKFTAANGEEPSSDFVAWLSGRGMLPEQVWIDPAEMKLLSDADGAQPPLAAASSDGEEAATELEPKTNPSEQTPQTNEAEDPPQVDASKEETPGQEPTSEGETDEAETATGAEAATPAKAVMPDESLSVSAIDENPWSGIELSKLERLRPMLMWRPIENKLVSLNPVEGFMIWLKAGLVAGVIIGSPGIFFHIWQFIAAGLYPHERRYVYWYLPLSLILFLAGVSLAFFVVFEFVLGFLMKYSTNLNVEFTPRLSDYMSFALFLPLGFGIAFQLPIVMLGLHRFGLVSVNSFISQWRIAVLAIAFLSMLLSPPDIYSMMGLFGPLVVLYFFGIFLCKYMPQGAGVGGPGRDPQA